MAGAPSPVEQIVIPWPHQRPRVVVRGDVLPALGVFAVVALLGVPVGWLWSLLAPPERMRVLPGANLVSQTSESYHRFDDLALFTLLGLAAGVIVAVAVWRPRRWRGPVVMAAAIAGSALGGWLATRTGLFFAESGYPSSPFVPVGATVLRAPQLESAWVVLAQPLATAFVYGLLVAWNGTDDLGRGLG